MPKGSRFEREICTDLSFWWSGGERDDIFWRTHGSGARATTRFKQGKTTKGQHGDIAATDPSGKLFTDTVTVSLKRGYSKDTIHDIVDKPYGCKMPKWEQWIMEAETDAEDAGTPFWMIISRRDRRRAIVLAPHKLLSQFPLLCSRMDFGGMRVVLLEDFMDVVLPDHFKTLVLT
jgi:hypothetical protein